MSTYTDDYKKRMNKVFGENASSQPVKSVKPASSLKNNEKSQEIKESRESIDSVRIKKRKTDLTLLILLLGGFFLFSSFLLFFYSDNSLVWIMIIGVALIGIFAFLILFFKGYEKSLEKTNPVKIVGIVYILLLINMYLGSFLYSVEWAFLGFVVAAVVFYDARTDSRFLIFPALLLLGYIPFLLIGGQNPIAETIAIYVYYFLVVGVFLQVVEHLKESKNSVGFDNLIKKMIYNQYLTEILIFAGIVSVLLIIINRFKEIELLKWTFVYVFAVLLVFYGISLIKKEDEE